jgi:hypothetical protein
MGHPESSNTGWAERHRDALTTHHSHEDVLDDREFERLLEPVGTYPSRADLRRDSSACSVVVLAFEPAKSHTSRQAG